jgi:hypothetical protein
MNREKINNFIPYIIALSFFLSSGFVLSHHEMWRDEMAAYLLSRDSSSLVDLIKLVRYEGHSFLWYGCLRFSHYLFNSVYSMQILSAFISTSSVFIFTKYSPFRLWQKLFFVFGYFQFFQYTVLSRDYCLVLPLLFTFATLYNKRVSNYIFLSFIIVLLSFVNIYALIAAGALFVGLAYEFVFNLNKNSLSKLQLSLFIAFNSLGLMVACYQITPPADTFNFSVYHPDMAANLMNLFVWNSKYADNLREVFTLGFIGLIRQGTSYWDGGLMYPDFFRHVIFPFILLMQVYTFFLLRKNKSLLVTYFVFILSFIVFSYCFYQNGSQRHAGILLLFWMLMLWMANYKNNNYKDHKPLLANPTIHYSLSILLALQFIGAINASVNDIKYEFSAGRSLAYFLKDHNYLNDNYIISAYPDWAGLSSIGYLPENIKYYYYHGRLFNTYNVSDSRRTDDTPTEKLACEAYKLSIEANKKVLVILARHLYEMDTDLKKFTPLFTSKGESTVAENFDVLLIDKSSKNKISNCKEN